METEHLTTEHLDAEQLWFERHCAAVILQALADSGMSMNDVDDRLRKKHGYMKRFIGCLAEGRTGTGKEAVMLAAAMDARIVCRTARLHD